MALPTEADWRALVEKELGGTPFDKALVQPLLQGVSVAPLYTERPAAAFRELRPHAVKICMRYSAQTEAADANGGADALWCEAGEFARSGSDLIRVVDPARMSALGAAERLRTARDSVLCANPLATKLESLPAALDELPRLAQAFGEGRPCVLVDTVAFHDAGADAADELACALSAFVLYLRHLDDPAAISFRVAVGRDTFLEVSKLRALRACHARLLAVAGVKSPPRALVHAVSSSRTLTQRDPWVNMLRVTTQAFAAIVGGADLYTPVAFDAALGGTPSALGHRVARNTALVLRDESGLDRVADPAGGSYALESLTESLAREAWKRFQELERSGGIAHALARGELAARFERSAHARAELVAKRKLPILGVGEFANLEEVLPRPPSVSQSAGSFPVRRDAEPLESLRTRVESTKRKPVLLLALGPQAESRARVGFAQGLFAAAGLRSREVAQPEGAAVVCLCGSDERYASEAVARVAELKALGARKVLLAGRPNPDLEKPLRDAGLDGFIFLGCDVVATVAPLLEVLA